MNEFTNLVDQTDNLEKVVLNPSKNVLQNPHLKQNLEYVHKINSTESYKFRQRAEVNHFYKENKYVSLKNVPIDENILIQIEDTIVIPRKKSLQNILPKKRRIAFVGFSEDLLIQTSKTIAGENDWLYTQIEASDILMRFTHIEEQQEYVQMKSIFQDAAEKSMVEKKPHILLINNVDGILTGTGQDSMYLMMNIRNWLFEQINLYAPMSGFNSQDQSDLIIIFTTSKPYLINEVLFQKLVNQVIFFDFPSLKIIKLQISQEILELEKKANAFDVVGNYLTDDSQDNDPQDVYFRTAANGKYHAVQNDEQNFDSIISRDNSLIDQISKKVKNIQENAEEKKKDEEQTDDFRFTKHKKKLKKKHHSKSKKRQEYYESHEKLSQDSRFKAILNETANQTMNGFIQKVSFIESQSSLSLKEKFMLQSRFLEKMHSKLSIMNKCDIKNDDESIQVIKMEGVKVVIEKRKDAQFDDKRDLMNSDNVLMIVGKRTCVVFDGDFDSLLRDHALAIKTQMKSYGKGAYVSYDKAGLTVEDVKQWIKSTIQLSVQFLQSKNKNSKSSNFMPVALKDNDLLITNDAMKANLLYMKQHVLLSEANQSLEWASMHNFMKDKIESVSKDISSQILDQQMVPEVVTQYHDHPEIDIHDYLSTQIKQSQKNPAIVMSQFSTFVDEQQVLEFDDSYQQNLLEQELEDLHKRLAQKISTMDQKINEVEQFKAQIMLSRKKELELYPKQPIQKVIESHLIGLGQNELNHDGFSVNKKQFTDLLVSQQETTEKYEQQHYLNMLDNIIGDIEHKQNQTQLYYKANNMTNVADIELDFSDIFDKLSKLEKNTTHENQKSDLDAFLELPDLAEINKKNEQQHAQLLNTIPSKPSKDEEKVKALSQLIAKSGGGFGMKSSGNVFGDLISPTQQKAATSAAYPKSSFGTFGQVPQSNMLTGLLSKMSKIGNPSTFLQNQEKVVQKKLMKQ